MSVALPLETIFFGVWITLAVIGLCVAIQFYLNKIQWPQARGMGITMAIFAWMNAVYGIILFEGVYAVASVILDLPLLIDVALFVAILAMAAGVYLKLRGRPKFKSAAFVSLFLVPLSIPGLPAVAKLMPEAGKVAPAVVKIMPLTPAIQMPNKLVPADQIVNIPKSPINRKYAGRTYPLGKLPIGLQEKYPRSVYFKPNGYPDFTPYAKSVPRRFCLGAVCVPYKQKKFVIAGLNGNYPHDFHLANKAAGYDKTPSGFTWHHHEDGKTMILVPTDLHREVRHSGGAAILREKNKSRTTDGLQ